MSYINREELLAELYKRGLQNSEVSEIVNEMEAVEPVQHGQWLGCMSGFECSICGGAVEWSEGMLYCSHCGAKMDGGAK